MNYYETEDYYFWHPWKKNEDMRKNRIMVKGDGCYVTNLEGNRYLDAASGALNVSCGYSQHEIIDAMNLQARELIISDTVRFSSLPTIKLAATMAKLLDYKLVKTFFCTSGSEATETAIKMARLYMFHKYGEERNNIISFEEGYHGSTFISASASHSEFVQKQNGPLASGFHSIETPRCEKCTNFEEHAECVLPDPLQLEEKIKQLNANMIAAFIMEPIMGIGGFIIPPIEYVQKVYDICKKYNILFILDETMTGFGRTGKWFAFEHFDVVPDILVTGKGICSGYFPLSAISTTKDIFEKISLDKYLGGFRHGHTNSGHATGCSVALAVIDFMQNKNIIDNSKQVGAYILQNLEKELSEFDFLKNFRGKGLLIAFDVLNLSLATMISEVCFELGLIVRQTGKSIGILPPLILNQQEAEEICHKLKSACEIINTKIEEDYQCIN